MAQWLAFYELSHHLSHLTLPSSGLRSLPGLGCVLLLHLVWELYWAVAAICDLRLLLLCHQLHVRCASPALLHLESCSGAAKAAVC